jgi:hypothetical protein
MSSPKAGFVMLLASPFLYADDIAGGLPSLPSGFANAVTGSSALKSTSAFEGGLDFSLNLNSLYDTNVTQASGTDSEVSDFVVNSDLRAAYLAGNTSWKLGADANLGYRKHFERTDFSDFTYGLTLYGGYQSKKTVASFSTSLSSQSGVNLESATYLDQLSFQNRFLLRYRLSGKTSLLASWNQTSSESQTAGFNDTSSWTADLSAIWRATAKVNLGPGIRYGVRGGSNNSELTVIGPTLRLNYDLTTKVSLRSTLGMDFSDSPFADSTELFNWSVALTYKASSFWGFDLSMIRDTQATFSQGSGFDEITSFELNYWRRIRRSRATLGITYQDRAATDALLSSAGARGSEYITFTAGYSMPIFKSQASLNLNLSYRDFGADASDRSWDGMQSGLGIGYRF